METELVDCPHCDGQYLRGPGLTRHIMTTHADIPREPGPDDSPCPHCGKVISKASLARHLRNVHDIHQRRRRLGRPPGSLNKRPAIEPRPKPPAPSPKLTADEVAAAAAGVLFPSGVPHTKLRPLLAWTVQTHDFLQEVQE